MDLKKNKGFTGVDISIALIVLIIFVGTIATIIYNFEVQSKAIERKSEATSIIIDILEYAKASNFNELNTEYLTNYKDINYSDKNGYDITINCQTDVEALGIQNNNTENVAKKVTVSVKYLVGKNEQNLDIYTWILND